MFKNIFTKQFIFNLLIILGIGGTVGLIGRICFNKEVSKFTLIVYLVSSIVYGILLILTKNELENELENSKKKIPESVHILLLKEYRDFLSDLKQNKELINLNKNWLIPMLKNKNTSDSAKIDIISLITKSLFNNDNVESQQAIENIINDKNASVIIKNFANKALQIVNEHNAYVRKSKLSNKEFRNLN